MERRSINTAVEVRGDDAPKIIGTASRYYDGTDGTEYQLWDGAVERIMPGAFDRAVAEGDDVRALFNHDPSQMLGRTVSGTLQLTTSDRGLGYEVDLADTQTARDVAEHVRRGDVTGSSFAFVASDEKWRDDGDMKVREIRDVRLYDVSPVTYPAYGSTDVALRGHVEDARASYDAWQDSVAEARTAAVEAEQATLQARCTVAGL